MFDRFYLAAECNTEHVTLSGRQRTKVGKSNDWHGTLRCATENAANYKRREIKEGTEKKGKKKRGKKKWNFMEWGGERWYYIKRLCVYTHDQKGKAGVLTRVLFARDGSICYMQWASQVYIAGCQMTLIFLMVALTVYQRLVHDLLDEMYTHGVRFSLMRFLFARDGSVCYMQWSTGAEPWTI